MTKKNKGIICLLFVMVGFVAVAVFLCMASTLNPWSHKLPHLDSAVWLRCAVEMKQGKVIYRDVWDHKGPMLFAIQILGLTITPHSLNGIWLLECIFAFLTLCSLYLVAKLITDSRLVCFLAAVLSMHPIVALFCSTAIWLPYGYVIRVLYIISEKRQILVIINHFIYRRAI